MINKLLLLLLISSLLYSQESDHSLLIKAGRASDNDSWGNFGGGGGGESWWDSGPQITVGFEKYLDTKYSASFIISYSWFRYNDPSFPYDNNTNSGYKRYFDIMSNIKYNIWVFYISLGAGFSHQSSDEIRYIDSTHYHFKNSVKYPNKNKLVFSGMFSLGLDIYIYNRFSIIAEGDLFFREYFSSSWQIGIKYSIPEL